VSVTRATAATSTATATGSAASKRREEGPVRTRTALRDRPVPVTRQAAAAVRGSSCSAHRCGQSTSAAGTPGAGRRARCRAAPLLSGGRGRRGRVGGPRSSPAAAGRCPSPNGEPPSSSRPCGVSQFEVSGPTGTTWVG
jgi:hypothetical protein